MSRQRLAFAIAFVSCLLLAHSALAGINFTGGELTNVSPRPEYMAAGDFDDDGRTDVVVVSPSSKEINVYLADDTPSKFAPARVLRFGQKIRNLTLGDLNADGRLDIIVADPEPDAIWILIGRGDGTFLEARQITVPNSLSPIAVAVGNFDDNGNLDLAVADERLAKVFIMLNDNANPPTFRRGGEINVGEKPTEINAVDLNDDGKLDIVTLNLGGPAVKEIAVALWRRVAQGFPEFDTPQRYTIGEKPNKLVTGDINNDGSADVLTLNKARGADGNSEVNALLNRGDGVLNPPIVLPVPCPFFTGGSPCAALSLAMADFDNNDTVDLMISLRDPRRTRGSASAEADAIQVFSGRGDGSFVPGGVYATQKVPITIAAGDVTGDGSIDVTVANQRTLDVQVFTNTSTAGDVDNGEPCLLGEDCLSSRCTNGVCCASACDPELGEVCNIPGREGICVPIPGEVIECIEDEECLDQVPEQPFCVDGFCCDLECIGGRCDVEGTIGVCIPGIEDGGECFGIDEECSSRNCCDNFICGRDPECEGGRCEAETGICRALSPPGTPCELNEECESNVCDAFDAICCNRVCNPSTEVCFPGEGICRPSDYTPPPRTSTPSPTPTVRLTPGAPGETCTDGNQCGTGNCVNNVCCMEPSCPTDQHCEEGTGECVDGGAPGTPTFTAVPTPIPTTTPSDPCENISCPGGQRCLEGLCVSTSTGGGCSTGGSDEPARGNLIAIALLPLAIWVSRRWTLQRARVRSRATIDRR